MPFSTIATPEAKPVANYKMATCHEGGQLLYISGQVARDTSGNIVAFGRLSMGMYFSGVVSGSSRRTTGGGGSFVASLSMTDLLG